MCKPMRVRKQCTCVDKYITTTSQIVFKSVPCVYKYVWCAGSKTILKSQTNNISHSWIHSMEKTYNVLQCHIQLNDANYLYLASVLPFDIAAQCFVANTIK